LKFGNSNARSSKQRSRAAAAAAVPVAVEAAASACGGKSAAADACCYTLPIGTPSKTKAHSVYGRLRLEVPSHFEGESEMDIEGESESIALAPVTAPSKKQAVVRAMIVHRNQNRL
jgi:hypothetical protein